MRQITFMKLLVSTLGSARSQPERIIVHLDSIFVENHIRNQISVTYIRLEINDVKSRQREKDFIKWNKIATKSHGGTLEDMLPLMVASMRYEGAQYLIKHQNKVLAGSDIAEREKFYQARLDKVSDWLGLEEKKKPWLDLSHIPKNIRYVPPNDQDAQFQ